MSPESEFKGPIFPFLIEVCILQLRNKLVPKHSYGSYCEGLKCYNNSFTLCLVTDLNFEQSMVDISFRATEQ